MNKYFFVDTETTGTEVKVHGLVQLSGLVVIGGDIVDTIDLMMHPFREKAYSMGALEVIGKSREEIDAYPDPRTQHAMFLSFLSKHVDKYDKADKLRFCAYNAAFDGSFVRQWFKDCNDKYFGSHFWYPLVDVAQTAFEAMTDKERSSLSNFKLATVAKFFGVDVKEDLTHEAMYDTLLAFDLYNKICDII